MRYFIISFQIIFPILFYMMVGLAVRQTKLVGEETFSQINRLVFQVFLPVKLFLEIYQSDFSSVFRPELILYGALSILVIYLLSWKIIGHFVKDRKDAPTLIQMIYRSNYVLFGLSIAENMYPNENLSTISVLAAFVVPIFNILAVILFEIYRGNEKVSLPHLLKGIAKNSLVIGSVLGLLAKGIGIEIPALLQKPLADLGAIATPLAVLCVGATLSFDTLRKYSKYLIWAAVGRLVIVPGVFLGLSVALGFRGIELAGLGVAVSNVACLFTLFLWIILLKFFALC